ncbi:Mom family adenine methylcarbamoylation protein [Ligilactobacillus murinus]|uniref:Mom family adenine methylcarbamoylation protein n=1 Tax=Ligilactobacillus murinus TaxID=1622 RepID=UPI001CDB9EF9|nr:protein Mom [Ligilactobacillus murinus]
MTIRVGYATKEATKYACQNWHYSKCVPAGSLFSVGVWEDNHFLGVVIFSHGANNKIGNAFSLSQHQCVELTRIALRSHKGVFVSEIMAKAIKFFKQKNSNVILIISYADPKQKHKGGIYQATNWLYVGVTKGSTEMIINRKQRHGRSVSSMIRSLSKKYKYDGRQLEFIRKYVDANAKEVKVIGKHKYLMPLTKKARRKLKKYAQEYPKKYDDFAKETDVKVDLSDC